VWHHAAVVCGIEKELVHYDWVLNAVTMLWLASIYKLNMWNQNAMCLSNQFLVVKKMHRRPFRGWLSNYFIRGHLHAKYRLIFAFAVAFPFPVTGVDGGSARANELAHAASGKDESSFAFRCQIGGSRRDRKEEFAESSVLACLAAVLTLSNIRQT
jgi:hypothetical protein